jgi:hypothetical protein
MQYNGAIMYHSNPGEVNQHMKIEIDFDVYKEIRG